MERLLWPISAPPPTHYETLGLDRSCTAAQIRDAYRQLAKRYHPDVNQNAAGDRARIQALNASYEILSDPARRLRYDGDLDLASRSAARGSAAKIERNVKQEVRLRLQDFFNGASIEVQVRDPANASGAETYRVQIPPGSAPGSRLRVRRDASAGGGVVELQLKAMPSFRFKMRGSDLRCDLRISSQRAEHGGSEMVECPTGGAIRVQIPPRVKRGEVIRLAGEGMPKARGGRGDLLVRITYRPDVRVTRTR
ncbi:MAG: DnaJ domain-containing protein [Verrucomicrobiota bacterium]|nr:DnaJ domain-containing protein [Verrucomicrobiota bacterium]